MSSCLTLMHIGCFIFIESSNSLIESRDAKKGTIYHDFFQSKIIKKKQLRASLKVFCNGGVLTKAKIASLNESFKVAIPLLCHI